MKAIIIFLIFTTQFLFMIEGSAQSLDQHLWQNRILLIFANDEQDSNLKKQCTTFNNETAALKERRIIIYTITSDQIITTNGSPSGGKILVDKIRDEFKVKASDFTVILIGLDGTEKRRVFSIIEPQQLFGIIDQMPMRRNEIKKSKQN